MKLLFIIPLLAALTGCAAVDKVKQMWPRPHDPVLFSNLVTLNIKVNSISCSERSDINDAISVASWLTIYTEFRDDPQKASAKSILENLIKAKEGSEAACERWVSLSKTRIKIIKEAWSGR